MINFLLYLFYRSENIKNRHLALRGDSVLAFFPAINCASLLIFIMKLLALPGIINSNFTTPPYCIAITGGFFMLFILLEPVYMYVIRKKVRKTIYVFKQETTTERQKNGEKIRRYIFISFIAIVVAILL